MGGNEAEQQLEPLMEELEESSNDARLYWWVNQGVTHRDEVEGGYLWAPIASKGGNELAHHRSMADLQVGDTVFHYWLGRIQAVSSVTEEAVYSPIPAELANQGWQRTGWGPAAAPVLRVLRSLSIPGVPGVSPGAWGIAVAPHFCTGRILFRHKFYFLCKANMPGFVF